MERVVVGVALARLGIPGTKDGDGELAQQMPWTESFPESQCLPGPVRLGRGAGGRCCSCSGGGHGAWSGDVPVSEWYPVLSIGKLLLKHEPSFSICG